MNRAVDRTHNTTEGQGDEAVKHGLIIRKYAVFSNRLRLQFSKYIEIDSAPYVGMQVADGGDTVFIDWYDDGTSGNPSLHLVHDERRWTIPTSYEFGQPLDVAVADFGKFIKSKVSSGWKFVGARAINDMHPNRDHDACDLGRLLSSMTDASRRIAVKMRERGAFKSKRPR
jgi:hypothetical protein